MAKRNFVGAKGARLLRRVAKHILAEPRRYNQDTVISKGKPGELNIVHSQRYPACGTIACIGGWATILGGIPKFNYWGTYPKLRAALGGIPLSNARNLFAAPQDSGDEAWPESFRLDYINAPSEEERARIAAARIEHFIKTGE